MLKCELTFNSKRHNTFKNRHHSFNNANVIAKLGSYKTWTQANMQAPQSHFHSATPTRSSLSGIQLIFI